MTLRLTPERRAELRKQIATHTYIGLSGTMLPVHTEHLSAALDDIDDLNARLERLDPINLDTNALECAEATRKLALNENERLHEEILKVEAQLASMQKRLAESSKLDTLAAYGQNDDLTAKLAAKDAEIEQLTRKNGDLYCDRRELWDALIPKRRLCRDCADLSENGRCPHDNVPCEPQAEALEIINALKSQRDSAGVAISDAMVWRGRDAFYRVNKRCASKAEIEAALTAANLAPGTRADNTAPCGCAEVNVECRGCGGTGLVQTGGTRADGLRRAAEIVESWAGGLDTQAAHSACEAIAKIIRAEIKQETHL